MHSADPTEHLDCTSDESGAVQMPLQRHDYVYEVVPAPKLLRRHTPDRQRKAERYGLAQL
jgi:hypothetical protein